MIERRDYQVAMKEQTYAAWNERQNVLNVLSTGGGKSVIMSDIVQDCANFGMTQAVIAHRNELVSQMSAHVGRRGVHHRIIGSDATVAQIRKQHRAIFHGQQFVHPSAKTSVVGVDTMISRQTELEKWAQQHDRWMIDEAHHTILGGGKNPNKWGKAILMMPNALGAGFTATPCRADGQGLGRHSDGAFDVMNIGPSMRELIRRGYLADFEIACPTSDMQVTEEELSKGGDWTHKTLRKAAKKSHIVGDVVENWLKYASGRQTIVFATDVETAGEIADKFNAVGVRAASVSAKTPSTVRDHYDESFKSGALTVLVNVDLYDEGYDVPACDVVIMARPTASLGKYRQQVGRALRPAPGKIALIIDMVSNVVRHHLPDKHIDWTLDRRDKKAKQVKDPDEIPLTTCRSCTRPYERFMVACPHCGAEKPLPEPRSRSIEMVEGDLILLDRETLERMRAATELEAPGDIAARVAAAANQIAGMAAAKRQREKFAAHEELRDTLAQWAGVERARGFSDREIQRKFFHVTGMDVITALDGKRPTSEMNSLSETIKQWWRV